MFKLMIRYNNEGEFIDSVYPPLEYSVAVTLLNEFRKFRGHANTYILVEVLDEVVAS